MQRFFIYLFIINWCETILELFQPRNRSTLTTLRTETQTNLVRQVDSSKSNQTGRFQSRFNAHPLPLTHLIPVVALGRANLNLAETTSEIFVLVDKV